LSKKDLIVDARPEQIVGGGHAEREIRVPCWTSCGGSQGSGYAKKSIILPWKRNKDI